MDTKILRSLGTSAALLIGLITTSPVQATSTGAQTLGAAANAVDVWTFTCLANTVRAQANVVDTTTFINNSALMEVVLGKAGFPSAQTRDVAPVATNGEGGASSPTAWVNGGQGLYTMVFKKTANGNETYVGNAICVNAAGAIAHPFVFRQINQ